MKPALGFKNVLKSHSDALHKGQEFKIISSIGHGTPEIETIQDSSL
jgi:hypothetical protein